MFSTEKIILAGLVLSMIIQEGFSFKRQGHRQPTAPQCPVTNCHVGQWSNWSPCTDKCVNAGMQRRSRIKLVHEQCGGKCPYNLTESRDVDECVIIKPCQHKCINTYGSYTCQCNSCYTKVGTRCDLTQCIIGGKCYRYGNVNPSNQCQDCNSSNKLGWTNNNALKCSDGQACTRADHCSNGRCTGTPFTCLPCEYCHSDTCKVKTGYCTIVQQGKKTCFNNTALRPGYPCQRCDVNGSTRTWSHRNGASCDDNNKCTRSDTCTKGQCTGTAFTCNSQCQNCNGRDCSQKTGFGFVNGKCTCRISGNDYNHQEVNPANQCQWCDLSDSASKPSGSWTNRTSVPCNDNNECY